VTGLLVVLALVWFKTGGVNGGGYETLSAALAGRLAIEVMLVLCLLKVLATVFSYGSGGAGGLFAPSLFIGGMLGGAFGYLDTALLHHGAENSVGAFALVGMGAFFAAVIRAPITSVLIIFEMTGGYGLILPLMIANMTAYGLARRLRPTPIYEALLEQDGVHLPHRHGAVKHALEVLRVAEAMTPEAVTLPDGATVEEALKHIGAHDYSTYPVVTAGAPTSAWSARRGCAERWPKGAAAAPSVDWPSAASTSTRPAARARRRPHEPRRLAPTGGRLTG
jgi:CIC family chloride channel protein